MLQSFTPLLDSRRPTDNTLLRTAPELNQPLFSLPTLSIGGDLGGGHN